MDQFLLNYWWIILIIFFGLLLLVKNLIKLLITLITISIIFTLSWQIFISDGFSKSTLCFTEEAKNAKSSFNESKKINQGKERDEEICVSDIKSLARLKSCLDSSQRESALSFYIYSNLPRFNIILNESVAYHNKMCPRSPLEKLTFSY